MEIIRRYPLLFIGFAWLIGLILGEIMMQAWLVAVPAFVMGTALVAGSYRLYSARSYRWLVVLLCGFLLLGLARDVQYNLTHRGGLDELAATTGVVESAGDGLGDETVGAAGSLVGLAVSLRGYIATDPVRDGDLLKFMMTPVGVSWAASPAAEGGIWGEQPLATQERVLVHLYLQDESDIAVINDWERGMGILLEGEFTEINLSSNPGQFDYEKYLAREHVYHKLVVIGIDDVRLSASSAADYRLNRIRRALTNTFEELFTEAEAGFLKSILLGESGDLPADLRDNFAITGLSHILAISGLHLSIITFLLFSLLQRARMTRENAAATVMLVLVIYLIIIGLRPSVVRATVMSLLMLYGIIFRNRIRALQTLGVALLLMTLYNPLWIYNVGFQLSFTITFFILFAFPEVERLLNRGADWAGKAPGNWRSKLLTAVALVATTQLASFPIIFYNFHQYSLIAWLANLIVVPLFSSLILPFALLILVLGTIKLTLALLPAKLLSQVLQALFAFTEWSASLTSFHFYGNLASLILVLSCYVGLVWLIFRQQIRDSFIAYKLKRLLFLGEKLILASLLMALIIGLALPKPVQVTFIDVGQGDSCFIRTASGQTLLIDSGGTLDFPREDWRTRANPFEVGKNILVPFLKYQGVKRIDYAFLTHEDADHLKGFFAVLDQARVGAFIAQDGFPRTELGQLLALRLLAEQVPVYQVSEPFSFRLDQSSRLTLLPALVPGSPKENDQSYVILAELYGTTLLLAADVEEAGEDLLLTNYELPEVDFLKVGHHGSKTSTSENWLTQLSPKNAIISVGLNNRYRHPADEVVDRLIVSGAKIWRTDELGAVSLRILPKKVEISGNRPGR